MQVNSTLVFSKSLHGVDATQIAEMLREADCNILSAHQMCLDTGPWKVGLLWACPGSQSKHRTPLPVPQCPLSKELFPHI